MVKMVGKTLDYSSVPTTADLENNTNTKKYTVSGKPKGVVIPKLCCCFLIMGAIILAGLAALAVFLLLPGCAESKPEALTRLVESVSNEEALDTRLPSDLYPTHYRIQLMPFIVEGNFTTHGSVSINIKVKTPTNKIIINANDIEIDTNTLRVKRVKGDAFLRISNQGYHPQSQIYTIEVDKNMKEGEEYRVDINFVGNLNDLMQGFYRSSYVDNTNNQIRWMASTQFSPTDARRAFPCFDEPAFKARFTISIARPANMSSLSNMPKKETVKSNEMENWYWDHYLETPKMSTYLVAFVVSDLQPFEFNTTGRLFTIWSRKGAIDQAVFASNIGPRVLQYFENYFNIPYPLPKIDMVAVPDFGFSAMENWGLITFRETALLIENKLATIDNKRDVALTMGHELAHQWFGNLATPEWWDDLWLKEGFATYFEYLGINHVEPSWNISDEFAYSEIQDAFALDGLESSRALSFNVQNSNQIRQAFNKISYSKGASIIRMMEHFLGEETFKSGLINYLNKHQYGNANHEDLWNDLTENAHNVGVLEPNITVKDIMDTWAKQPGYPVINAVADYEKNVVHLTQKRFLISGEESSEETTWWVPISYATRSLPDFENTKPKVWMKNENHTEFSLDTRNWWLLNLKKTGYYIVNYDENNWKNIIISLMSFPPVIRAQLVSDAMDLAKANLLDYDVPLKLVLAIGRRDDQFITYITTFDKLGFLYNMLIHSPSFGKFDVFLSAAFNAAFENTGFLESPLDSYVTQRKRRTILQWACMRSDSRCVIESRHLYRAWMMNAKPISPNVRGIVYCTAIREGGEAEWNFAYEQYLKTNIVTEKNILLSAMGCSSKPWILTRYLNFMISKDSGVRKQDGELLFSSVANNIVGNSLAFDFIRSNWKEINEYYGVAFSRVSKMISSLTVYMNNPYHLSQLEKFKNENNLGTTEQAVDHAIEIIKGNIRWMNNSYKSVEKWLDDHSIHFGN